MRYIRILILVFCVLLFNIGCSRETCITPLGIEYQGIVLSSSDGGLCYTGDMSSDETDFSITCSRPLTKVMVNRVVCQDEYGNPQLSSYWGDIVYTHQDSPMSLEFHINENSSNEDRLFVFVFGSGNKTCKISLKQHH